MANENHENRTSVRFTHDSTISLEQNEVGILHEARMFNYSSSGLYFESDFYLIPGTEIFIGLKSSPFTSAPGVYECYRSAIQWRKYLENSVFDYGYGVELKGKAPSRGDSSPRPRPAPPSAGVLHHPRPAAEPEREGTGRHPQREPRRGVRHVRRNLRRRAAPAAHHPAAQTAEADHALRRGGLVRPKRARDQVRRPGHSRTSRPIVILPAFLTAHPARVRFKSARHSTTQPNGGPL